MARVYDDKIYLFGTFFHAIENGGVEIPPNWHTNPDLTEYDELVGKIRPIPLTPVIVNALSKTGAVFWVQRQKANWLNSV